MCCKIYSFLTIFDLVNITISATFARAKLVDQLTGFYVNLYLFNLYILQYDLIGWYLWNLKHKLLPVRIYFANKLSLNVAKTEFMVIGSRQKILAESCGDVSIKLQDQVISRVDHAQ